MEEGKDSILVVDDDADLLRLISLRLSAAGYAVATAKSGDDALEEMAREKPKLIITDLRMDGMDGLDLLEQIHKIDSALPVIMLTAHGSIPDAVAATKRGAFSFLTKPFDPKMLLEEVEKGLRLSGSRPPVNLNDRRDSSWRSEIVTRSANMEELLDQTRLVAKSNASVFIHGASGTGKELLARALHRVSARADRPFVAVNCSAIPEPLLESELFGHSKGSFTGATQNYSGLFQAAHTGTLFLDEIGDMPIALQVKLLRVLQDKQVRPVGSTQATPVDVRIISATHRDLNEEMEAGNFREDLFYRLNVVSLELPPLSERRDDIPVLAMHFLSQLSHKYKKNIRGFSSEAMELLVNAPWPGNVRQLFNVIEQTVALCITSIISSTLLPKSVRNEKSGIPAFVEARKRFEVDYLTQLLKITNGNVSQAAILAKRNRTEFYKLLNRHQLDPSLFKLPGGI